MQKCSGINLNAWSIAVGYDSLLIKQADRDLKSQPNLFSLWLSSVWRDSPSMIRMEFFHGLFLYLFYISRILFHCNVFLGPIIFDDLDRSMLNIASRVSGLNTSLLSKNEGINCKQFFLTFLSKNKLRRTIPETTAEFPSLACLIYQRLTQIIYCLDI